MKPRIAVLTSGGDCPGLNAVLRAVVLAADKLGWEVVGFRDGFEGLLPPGNHIILDRQAVNGIMALGGTILGTTNRGHFVAKVGAGHRTIVPAGLGRRLDERRHAQAQHLDLEPERQAPRDGLFPRRRLQLRLLLRTTVA